MRALGVSPCAYVSWRMPDSLILVITELTESYQERCHSGRVVARGGGSAPPAAADNCSPRSLITSAREMWLK